MKCSNRPVYSDHGQSGQLPRDPGPQPPRPPRGSEPRASTDPGSGVSERPRPVSRVCQWQWLWQDLRKGRPQLIWDKESSDQCCHEFSNLTECQHWSIQTERSLWINNDSLQSLINVINEQHLVEQPITISNIHWSHYHPPFYPHIQLVGLLWWFYPLPSCVSSLLP